jgi:hypothetical protein
MYVEEKGWFWEHSLVGYKKMLWRKFDLPLE